MLLIKGPKGHTHSPQNNKKKEILSKEMGQPSLPK